MTEPKLKIDANPNLITTRTGLMLYADNISVKTCPTDGHAHLIFGDAADRHFAQSILCPHELRLLIRDLSDALDEIEGSETTMGMN